MGALHARPIVGALVLACAQFQAWSDLMKDAGLSKAGMAYHANVRALDQVSFTTRYVS